MTKRRKLLGTGWVVVRPDCAGCGYAMPPYREKVGEIEAAVTKGTYRCVFPIDRLKASRGERWSHWSKDQLAPVWPIGTILTERTAPGKILYEVEDITHVPPRQGLMADDPGVEYRLKSSLGIRILLPHAFLCEPPHPLVALAHQAPLTHHEDRS